MSNLQVSATKISFHEPDQLLMLLVSKYRAIQFYLYWKTNEIKYQKKDHNYRLIKPKYLNRLTVAKLPLTPSSSNKIFVLVFKLNLLPIYLSLLSSLTSDIFIRSRTDFT